MTVHHGEDNPCDRWNNRKDTLLHSFRYCSAGYLVEKSRETFFKTKEKPAVFSASAGILSQQISFLEATDLPFETKFGTTKFKNISKTIGLQSRRKELTILLQNGGDARPWTKA